MQKNMAYLMASGYYISTAISFFLVHSINRSFYPFLSIFWTFLITLFIVNFINYNCLSYIYKTSFHNMQLTVWLNLITSTTWIFGFLALNQIPAWLYAIIAIGLQPIITFCLDLIYCLFSNRKIYSQNIGLEIAILIMITVFITLEAMFLIKNAFHLDQSQLINGCLFACAGAISGAISLMISGKFQKITGFKSTQILAVRFYFVIIISALILFFTNHWVILSTKSLSLVFIIAILTSLIPLYLLQNCINNMGAVKVSYFLPSVLLITYLIDVLNHRQIWQWQSFIIICLLTIFLFLAIIVRSKRELKKLVKIKQIITIISAG